MQIEYTCAICDDTNVEGVPFRIIHNFKSSYCRQFVQLNLVHPHFNAPWNIYFVFYKPQHEAASQSIVSQANAYGQDKSGCIPVSKYLRNLV